MGSASSVGAHAVTNIQGEKISHIKLRAIGRTYSLDNNIEGKNRSKISRLSEFTAYKAGITELPLKPPVTTTINDSERKQSDRIPKVVLKSDNDVVGTRKNRTIKSHLNDFFSEIQEKEKFQQPSIDSTWSAAVNTVASFSNSRPIECKSRDYSSTNIQSHVRRSAIAAATVRARARKKAKADAIASGFDESNFGETPDQMAAPRISKISFDSAFITWRPPHNVNLDAYIEAFTVQLRSRIGGKGPAKVSTVYDGRKW